MPPVKMTFQLDPGLHARLKTAAAQGGVTVRELLIEGAELALERRESRADLETLKTRSAAAKARMRRGYFALEAATEPLPK